MAKNLLYKLFGLRKLTAELRQRFDDEGVVFEEEGTSCAVGFRDFRGPRNASGRGWENAHPGTLVVTEQTFYVQLPYMLVCDKPVASAVNHFSQELKSAAELVMRFNADQLFNDATGELTCLWRTDNAPAIYSYLQGLKV